MSTLRADNAGPSAGGTTYSLTDAVAKAWARYNQAIPTLQASYNVTSVTDDGTGLSTVNLTNGLSSVANVTAGLVRSNGTVDFSGGASPASNYSLSQYNSSGALTDGVVTSTVHGVLA